MDKELIFDYFTKIEKAHKASDKFSLDILYTRLSNYCIENGVDIEKLASQIASKIEEEDHEKRE